jgi:uracil-DNA glycosylase
MGQAQAKIMLVGEAPGDEEIRRGEPFVGAAGRELAYMLRDAGLERAEFVISNVFRHQPEANRIETFCVDKKVLGPDPYPLPFLRPGQYIRRELLPELARLRREIEKARPNLVIALGNTALWALTGRSGIGKIRGTVCPSTLVPGQKVLPTYHPSAILRDWSSRVVVVADFLKAKVESEFPEIRRPRRLLWICPTLEDLHEFSSTYIIGRRGEALCPVLSIDIETDPKRGILLCVALAVRNDLALVLPFFDSTKPNYSYWSSPGEEVAAWNWLRCVASHPDIAILGQNYSYDFQWLFRAGVNSNFTRDTMIKHNALYPELPKSLAFQGSIYTQEPAWKLDRPRGYKVAKREE